MSEVSKLSDIRLSELWQKYLKIKRYWIGREQKETIFDPITKAINESPVQTLDRFEEIFRFIFNKYGHDREFSSKFDLKLMCCFVWATEQNIIDDETQDIICCRCSDYFYSSSKDEANINQKESQSSDEEI